MQIYKVRFTVKLKVVHEIIALTNAFKCYGMVFMSQ